MTNQPKTERPYLTNRGMRYNIKKWPFLGNFTAYPSEEVEGVCIPLTQDRHAIVSAEHFELVEQYNWSYHAGYALANVYIGSKRTRKSMHLLIFGKQHGKHVDHINRNGTDNRICNLRVATYRQNQANRPPQRDGLKGVCQTPYGWTAHIRGEDKLIHLGSFRTEKEAAIAYDAAALAMYGNFAYLNFTGVNHAQ